MNWHDGPPPFVGWWRVEAPLLRKATWSWWDGERWSGVCFKDEPMEFVALLSSCAWQGDPLRWSDYYPPNARVPRVKP